LDAPRGVVVVVVVAAERAADAVRWYRANRQTAGARGPWESKKFRWGGRAPITERASGKASVWTTTTTTATTWRDDTKDGAE
jgi:hypothetical protein